MNTTISLENQIVLMGNITVAVLLCMVIGFNREKSHKSAGLRTHILTGVGACLFTMLSLHAFPMADTSRVASNIVTGIGFLCGGVIIQRKNEAYDLTTAAGIWTTAAIGMAVGTGAWLLAAYATISVWVVLEVFKYLKPNSNADANNNAVLSEEIQIATATPKIAPLPYKDKKQKTYKEASR